MCCKHRLVEYRLCGRNGGVGITHLGCDDHTAFDNHIRFCSEECRVPENEISKFSWLHRSYILGNTVCDCRVDGIFGNISFYTEVVVSVTFIFRKRSSLAFHLACCLPGTGDDLTDTSHCLGIGAHHAEHTHIVKDILCCDRFRTDTGICKSDIFRDLFVQMVAYHQHVQMLIQSIYSEWHGRVCGRRKDVRGCCCFDDVRCMSAAGTFCMICMDSSSSDGIDGVFYASAFVQSICMDGNLYIIFICHIQAMVDNCRCCAPVLMDLESHRTCFDLLDQRFFIRAVSFSEET